MKKNLLLKLTIIMGATLFVGCGKEEPTWNENTESLGEIKEDVKDPEIEKTEELQTGEFTSESTSDVVSEELSENIENSQNEAFDIYIGKTIEDLVKDYPDLEENGYMSFDGIYTFYLNQKDAKYSLKITAKCDREKVDALGDIFEREVEDMFPLANIEEIVYVDHVAALENAKTYIGKKVSDMINDGYKIDGYVCIGKNVSLGLFKEDSAYVDVEIGEIENFDGDNYKTLYLDEVIEAVSINTTIY